MSRYHCCATCQHYAILRTAEGQSYQCARLGYATHPTYRFNCWNPKEHIRVLMESEFAQKRRTVRDHFIIDKN